MFGKGFTNPVLHDICQTYCPDFYTAAQLRQAGNTLFRKGKYEAALKEYSEAALRDSDNSSLLCNLSIVKYKLGDYDGACVDAVSAIFAALPRSRSWFKGLFHLSRALEHCGIFANDRERVRVRLCVLSIICAGHEKGLFFDLNGTVKATLKEVFRDFIFKVAAVEMDKQQMQDKCGPEIVGDAVNTVVRLAKSGAAVVQLLECAYP